MWIYVALSSTYSSRRTNSLGKIVFPDGQISDDLFVEKFVRPVCRSDDLSVRTIFSSSSVKTASAVCTCVINLIIIGHVRYINILTYLRDNQDQLLYLVLFLFCIQVYFGNWETIHRMQIWRTEAMGETEKKTLSLLWKISLPSSGIQELKNS